MCLLPLMSGLLASSAAWHRGDALWDAARDRGDVSHYLVDPLLCERVRGRFREDIVLLPWTGGLRCDDLLVEVRRGFETWEVNAHDLRFRQVWDASSSELLVTAQSIEYENALGYATTSTIVLDTKTCWYTDRAFCHAVRTNDVALHVGLAFAFLLSLAAVVWFVTRPVVPRSAPARLVAWAALFGVPLCYFGSMRPCFECYDFGMTVTHEVGHLLGLLHPDEPADTNASSLFSSSHWSGCGPNASKVQDTLVSSSSVMNSVIEHRSDACLSRDDVDGVRTLYGGDCGQPPVCYHGVATASAGGARLAIALVYGFALAWLAVALRNCFDHRRKTPVSTGDRLR